MLSPVDFRLNAQINTDRGPSPDIWANCPVLELLENPSKGTYFYDDFTKPPVLVTPTITTEAVYGHTYKAFGSAGGTIVPAALERGGGLAFTETDNDQGYSLSTIATPFRVSQGQGALWFECRLKVGTVADNDLGVFVGLIDSHTGSATVPIAAAGTMADENFVGFHRLEGDGDQIDTIYKADGVTQVSLQTDVLSTANVSGGVLVADTFIKLGMKFTPLNGRLYFYVNGVQLSTSKLLPTNTGTDFPADVNMGLVLAGLCGSNNDGVTTLDWWRAAQLHV